MSELLVIGVPDGAADGRMRLRVLLVPHPTGATLREAGLAEWPPPALLAGGTFEVDHDDGARTATVARVPVAGTLAVADPALWGRMFPADAPLGEAAARAAVDVDVHPTSQDAALLDGTLAAVAATEVPSDGAPPAAYDDAVREGLAPWQGTSAPTPPAPADPSPPPPPGVRRRLALLREHPAVLRALGLIAELTVPAAALPAPGRLRVRITGWEPAGGPGTASPWTAYGAGRRPAAGATVEDGLVTLAPPAAGGSGWRVVTVDVETGAQRAREAAVAVAGTRRRDGGPAAALPAMPSGGVQLLRVGRGDDMRRRTARARGNAVRAGGDLVLDADDLTLGYRIDIRRSGGPWRSLHWREARYLLDGELIASVREEGRIAPNGAVRGREGPAWSDEVVARWTGWSLAVAPPRLDGGRRARDGREAGFGWAYEVPDGSLPALRFTATYDVRARAEDLAGGGPGVDDADAERFVLTEIPYRRYEPVTSPAIALPAGVTVRVLGPGEAVDHLTIRSDPQARPGA
ncbi:MAG TPA: hypothetical protein VNT51_05290, partial [Miltoncostaeaceae bacterium]|nr:hypothetical protein [Miltoncostaeaceae bacterium]